MGGNIGRSYLKFVPKTNYLMTMLSCIFSC